MDEGSPSRKKSRLESIAGDKVVVDLVTPEKLDTYASPSATAKFTESNSELQGSVVVDLVTPEKLDTSAFPSPAAEFIERKVTVKARLTFLDSDSDCDESHSEEDSRSKLPRCDSASSADDSVNSESSADEDVDAMNDMKRYLELLPSKQPEYYEGDRGLPEFSRISSNRRRLLSVEDTVRCILHPRHSKGHLSSKVPTTVNHNVMFLVDTNALDDPQDIDSDDMGVWHNN